jgi:hypothetical protein
MADYDDQDDTRYWNVLIQYRIVMMKIHLQHLSKDNEPPLLQVELSFNGVLDYRVINQRDSASVLKRITL